MIHFQFSADIRGTAAQTMGAVLESSCKYMEMGGDVAQQAISGQLEREQMCSIWVISNRSPTASANEHPSMER